MMTMRSQGNVQQQTHRNCKAGEFKNELHEDMTLDDADLTDYPTNAAMIAAWNAGKNEAKVDGERLGMKHVNVTDDMWASPWKWDPKNPRVPHVDEYLRRKFGEDLSDSEDDDDDSSDSDDIPDLVPIDDVNQVQLDHALNSIRQTVENESTETDPVHMIRTPNNRLISKETAICMLREAFDHEGKLSKDRLKRIIQCAQKSVQNVDALTEEDDDTALELHKDIALSFDAGDGQPLQLWFGRVQKMVVVSDTGRRTLRLSSIPLENKPAGLTVMCNYYEKVPRRPRTYRYGTAPLETNLYSASSIICVVHFDYNPTHRTYTVPIEQWNHIRSELNRLNRSR